MRIEPILDVIFPNTLDKNTRKDQSKNKKDCSKCSKVVDCFYVNKTGCDLYA